MYGKVDGACGLGLVVAAKGSKRVGHVYFLRGDNLCKVVLGVALYNRHLVRIAACAILVHEGDGVYISFLNLQGRRNEIVVGLIG